MLLGKGVMINWTNVAPEHRPAYEAWQCGEHMPGRVAIPGFLRGRRYFGEHAERQFLTLYEVQDLSVLTGPDYMAKANAPSPLTRQTTPFVRDSVRGLSRVRASFGDGMGGAALTLRFDPLPQREAELERFLVGEALPACAQRYDILGAHFIVADQQASDTKPVERQGRPTLYPNWVIVLEGFTQASVNGAGDALLSNARLTAHGSAPTITRESYDLMFTYLSPRALGNLS